MKKKVIVVLECTTNREELNDNEIRSDLEQEISCCWHSFDIKSITVEDAEW